MKGIVPVSVSDYRRRGWVMALMAGWVFGSEIFGHQPDWLTLNAAAATFALLSWSDFIVASRMRRDEQARRW